MALVRKVSGKVDAAEKEKLVLGDLVPEYEWQTLAGETREGIKLHYLSYLPERQEAEKQQPSQFSGFLDSLTDPVTGTVRGGRQCVPFRITGAAAVSLAARAAGAVVLAEAGSQEAAKAAMEGFDPSEPWLVKGGSLYVDLRPEAEGEVLRGDDKEMVAVYATSGALSGRMMYAPAFEFEEGFE